MAATLVTIIVFLAALVQTLSGFGFALLVMPLITIIVGLQTAAPLVALAGMTLCGVNLIRYRQAVHVRKVLRLGVASVFGIPIGFWALANVDESIIKPLLGVVLIAYAAYKLISPSESHVCSRRWAYPAGFVAGCLSGAYNTPGPPVIVYGSLRQWPKEEFRAVLQAFFFVNAVFTVASHTIARHLTTTVWTFYGCAVPALLLGVFISSRIDSRLNRDRFRTIVTAMILVLGISLILS
jgi:uncharacterized membrane protein YfcA